MKRLWIFIAVAVVLIAVYGGYHSYLRHQCADRMGLVYQQRIIDSARDKNPEAATRFANEMLSIDMQGCQLQ